MKNKINKRTKKLILILCIIAATVVAGVLIYNFVWLQSLHHMEPDSDRGIYITNYTRYYNGILSTLNLENNSLEIFENGEKKVVSLSDFPEQRTPIYDGKYFTVHKNLGYAFYDLDLKKIGEVLVNERVSWWLQDEKYYYCGNLKNIYRCNVANLSYELIFTAGDFEIHNTFISNGNIYIEYADKLKLFSTVIKYNIKSKKIIEKHKINITQFELNKDDYYSTLKRDNYIYYMYDFINNPIHPIVYRYNMNTSEMQFIAKFDSDIEIKENDIFYVGTSTPFKTQDKNPETVGLWKLNLDTMETTLVSNKVRDGCHYFCTDNYVYSYKLSSVGLASSSSLPSFRIYRGYTLDQIPLN